MNNSVTTIATYHLKMGAIAKNTMQKIKATVRVPTSQYAFLELEGAAADIEKMISLGNRFAEKKITEGEYVEIQTFTGETVFYNAILHIYKDAHGNPLESGSAYAKSLEKPFDLKRASQAIAKKYALPVEIVADMWARNGDISRTFGTALHLAMEQYNRHKKNGTEKEYHLPKHPFLRSAVTTFPLCDADILPEIMVSDVSRRMVGQIDGLLVEGEKTGVIVDYKSDGDVGKNLPKHFNQLSFYADILRPFGWNIRCLQVWNYTDKWECYESEVLPIKIK